MLLKEQGFGLVEFEAQKKARKQITENWDRVNFLDGLDGYVKENVAMLYENEAKWLNESTDSSNSGAFETVVFPIIRRVFSKLLANDIVSVQAMNLPIGKLFFILPVTSQRTWDNDNIVDGAAGSHTGLMGYTRQSKRDKDATENRYYLPDEVVNPGADVTKYMEKSLYDLFYNNFLFDNSKGKVHLKVVSAPNNIKICTFDKNGIQPSDETTLAAAGVPVCGIDEKYRNVILKVTGFSNVNPGRLIGPDGNEMDSEAFVASLKVITDEKSYDFRFVTQRYGKGIVEYNDVCDAEGAIYLDVNLATPVKDTANPTADGFIGVGNDDFNLDDFKVVWAQYDSLELETEIGEVSFKLQSVTVDTEERKLRATWSPEMAQDVAAFHNIDAEAELTALLSEQIAAEIDREIIRVITREAPWVRNWDLNGWRKLAGFSTNYTQKDWNQTLITEIERISAQIHKATLRGGANFIVVSSEISAVFQDLEYFHVSDASSESDQYNMGIERVGELGGRFQVYRDPLLPHGDMIIGHKGKSLLDTGFIYAPYIPMQLTPTMYNPSNFAPVKGIMTRYAQKCVNNRFYGRVKAHSLPHWDINELR